VKNIIEGELMIAAIIALVAVILYGLGVVFNGVTYFRRGVRAARAGTSSKGPS
jgi:hypothetical protein